MKEIKLITADEPGVLGKLAEALGAAEINIETVSIEPRGTEALIHLITSNNDKAKEVCASKGYKVIDGENIVIVMRDKPGELARVGRILGEEKINITDLYLLDKIGNKKYFALSTSDNARAKQLLAEFL
ncbi:ACT domain-containing protein [Candidatus Micrarchaeota archaeon]|nr:ACT domain-containing protein [Candidatus Micrarchaeota archaeon]